MKIDSCLFCDKENKEKHKIILENDLFYARWDNFPVSNGHAEVVSKKHIVSFFELNNEEVLQMYDLIIKVKEIITDKFKQDGFNIGLNEGLAAGRTIHHLHIHIIPRYEGDVKNPRGGIRNIIPGKGNY
ncbi:HIT family protein [Candidatus Kuenenbacteria bacterium]|nr:HIT family protein [Candidatus Kuenenbacteria bacterium]